MGLDKLFSSRLAVHARVWPVVYSSERTKEQSQIWVQRNLCDAAGIYVSAANDESKFLQINWAATDIFLHLPHLFLMCAAAAAAPPSSSSITTGSTLASLCIHLFDPSLYWSKVNMLEITFPPPFSPRNSESFTSICAERSAPSILCRIVSSSLCFCDPSDSVSSQSRQPF